MLHTIDNLTAVVDLCRTRQPLPDRLAGWLADAINAYLELRADSLNEAFGLRRGRGGIPWHIEVGIRKRDAALRELCTRHFPQVNPSAQAQTAHQISTRYAASAWRFDRERDAMPDHYRGTPKEQLWLAFKSGATMPLCARQLRTILAASPSRGRSEAQQIRPVPPADS